MTTSTLRTSPRVIISAPATGPHPEVNRLLAAAVVNRQFRFLLLNDPVQALNGGYQGERFAFTKHERDLIFSISAKSLPELAEQLISSLGISAHSDQYNNNTPVRRVFNTVSLQA